MRCAFKRDAGCTASADIGAAITVDEAAGKVSISGTTGETKSCGVTLAV